MKAPSALILYNRPAGGTHIHALEADDIAFLREALTGEGYRCWEANIDDDVDRINDAVVVHRPTVIFQLVEHMWSDTALSAAVAGMLDLFGYVYTGSDSTTLVNCQDRARSHVLLEEAGLPVSPFAIVRDVNAIPELTHLAFPMIVSQAFDDIYDEQEHRPLLQSQDEVEAQCGQLAIEFDLPFLVEEHLPGKRVQACVLGNRVLEILPLTETVRDDDGLSVHTAQLEVDVAGQIRDLARRAFRIMGLRDVGQIDFALNGRGQPCIVDVRATIDFFGPIFSHAAEQNPSGLEGAMIALARHCHARLPAGELAKFPLC